jgi:hypothetical protein
MDPCDYFPASYESVQPQPELYHYPYEEPGSPLLAVSLLALVLIGLFWFSRRGFNQQTEKGFLGVLTNVTHQDEHK